MDGMTQLIRKAREGKGDFSVLMLDLANTYGSIPHKFIMLALQRHHAPSKVTDLILDYYNFRLRISLNDRAGLPQQFIQPCAIPFLESAPLQQTTAYMRELATTD